MSINYPLVPQSPGVPAVLRKNGSFVAAAVLLTKDAVTALISAPEQWGIFKDGKSIVIADSVVAIDYRKEWQISGYPIEKGGFQSYNKVQLPFDHRVALTKGGTEADRNNFLSEIEAAAASLDLYDVVTPEYTYTNSNITHIDYRRSAQNGAGLMTVTIWLQEIRNTASSAFTSVETAQPSGAPQVNNGAAQPQPLPPYVPPKANVQSLDNLPGFSAPLLNFSELGFQ